MRPWSVSGAKSRQGQLQEGPWHSVLSILGALLPEDLASRVALGTLGISKICQKTHFWRLDRQLDLQKWPLEGGSEKTWNSPTLGSACIEPFRGEVSSPLAPLRPGPPNFWPHPLSLTTRALCRFKAHCTGGCATTVQKPRTRSTVSTAQKPDSDISSACSGA